MKLWKKLRQFVTRTKSQDDPRSQLVRVYKDQNGHVYYRFRDPRQMPGARLRAAELAMKEAELSITAEDGSKMIDLAIEKFEQATRSKKFSGFGDGLNILVELKRRFVALIEEKTMLKLAMIYFTIDDEDPNFFLGSYQDKKRDAWDADPQCKDFFLCRGAEITQFYGDTSDRDILMYLKDQQPQLERATEFLQSRTFRTISEK